MMGELLHPARGENFAHPFVLCVNVVANRLLRVFVPQRQRHVLSNQPRFAVNLHGADRPKLGFLKISIWFISCLLRQCSRKAAVTSRLRTYRG